MTEASRRERIYHVTFANDWIDAQRGAEYLLSTRGASLDEVGYIHASFAHQVERVGGAVFRGASQPVVVLVIDTAMLTSPVRVENLEGGTEGFPHIYGPLPTSAVVDVLPARVVGEGLLIEGALPSA